jgi:hypothetical protein
MPTNQREETAPESGMGTMCPEAQADGVPCPDQGKPCEQCERALARRREQHKGGTHA